MKLTLSQINSGYIGDKEAWTNFFKNYTQSDYMKKAMIEFKKDLTIVNSNLINIINSPYKKTDSIQKIEKKLALNLPQSYKDFIAANGIEFFNEIYYLSLTFSDLKSPDEIYCISTHKEQLNEVVNHLNYSDEPYVKENYYSYNDYSDKLYIFNGTNNPKLSQSNLALGELSFGFLPEKKADYSKAIVIDTFPIPSVLLQPTELTQDSEMETWMMEDSDIYRFRSFAEFLINNLFFEHEIPKNMSTIEYLNLYGVNNILDFEVLRETAIP